MTGSLRIIKEQVQGNVHITVFHLRGWLDMQGEELLLATARDSYEEGSRYLLLDLAEVVALTSAGIRAMQKVYKIFTPAEERSKLRRVKLCNAPQQIYNVLGITGFLLTIENYKSMQAAIDSFTE
jgi:anti-anti-sigma regulatory factor